MKKKLFLTIFILLVGFLFSTISFALTPEKVREIQEWTRSVIPVQTEVVPIIDYEFLSKSDLIKIYLEETELQRKNQAKLYGEEVIREQTVKTCKEIGSYVDIINMKIYFHNNEKDDCKTSMTVVSTESDYIFTYIYGYALSERDALQRQQIIVMIQLKYMKENFPEKYKELLDLINPETDKKNEEGA